MKCVLVLMENGFHYSKRILLMKPDMHWGSYWVRSPLKHGVWRFAPDVADMPLQRSRRNRPTLGLA